MLTKNQFNFLKNIPQEQELLKKPLFVTEKPLWSKKSSEISLISFKNLKKYEFTKVGKILGFQTTRYLALNDKTLYYFEAMQSDTPLGSCDIQNVYTQWLKLAENRYVLVLNNGKESTNYFFKEDSFIRQQRSELAKYTVQLGFYSKYTIIEELGQGSFAIVYKVRDKTTKQEYSAKIISRDSSLAIIMRQIQILRQIKGVPHVCQYYGMFQTNEELIIVTKFVPGKDLRTLINYCDDLGENDVKTIILGVCIGLQGCHKQDIIHRDIKPQNLVINLDTMEVTIIDFGLSLDIKKPYTLNRCGTNSYMAPQVYNFPQSKKAYNKKCDIFSLGIVAHLLMLGNNPLKTKNQQQTVDRKTKLQWNQVKAKSDWGQKGYQFLEKTLSECCKNRWDINEVLLSQFLYQQKYRSLKQVDSCSTVEDKPHQIEI